jgi:hypothetical protein
MGRCGNQGTLGRVRGAHSMHAGARALPRPQGAAVSYRRREEPVGTRCAESVMSRLPRIQTHPVRGAHASCVLSFASLRRRSVPLMSPAGCRRLHAGSVGSPDRRGRCQRAFVFTRTGTRGELRCCGRGAARSLPLVTPEPSPSEGFPPIARRCPPVVGGIPRIIFRSPPVVGGIPRIILRSPPLIGGIPRIILRSPPLVGGIPRIILRSPPLIGGIPRIIFRSPPVVGGIPPIIFRSTPLIGGIPRIILRSPPLIGGIPRIIFRSPPLVGGIPRIVLRSPPVVGGIPRIILRSPPLVGGIPRIPRPFPPVVGARRSGGGFWRRWDAG